jgi:3',5'-cyclic AMP phosphodiesterase CpdA
MALLIHLSDLHLTNEPGPQELLFERLVQTLELERKARAGEHVAIVITGDVFDTVEGPPETSVASFLRLHERMLLAVGGDVPTIILPGNHDRRRFGLVGPHHAALFQALADAVDPQRVFVAGCKTPFLAELVPQAFHGLPAHVVTLDSSYLPYGLLSAGGTIRLQDLLQVHAELPRDDKPLLVLVHHHLIPTPITDVSHVNSLRAPRIMRWFVSKVLPALVSYGDREELTMTALGAGTALSALNSFGRAVLLLHGHKHVPTARVLRGMTDDCGDILLASAGSAGLRERVGSTDADAARLWPTFNLVELEPARVRVQALSFSPKRSATPPIRRELADARLVARKWDPIPVSFRPSDAPTRIALDQADYHLSRSLATPGRFDLSCERQVELEPDAILPRYVDFVHALPLVAPRTRRRRAAMRRIELTVGGVTRCRIEHALCRTLDEGKRSYGAGAAFEWVGLHCRYGARRATLRLAREGADSLRPFASITDLATGREQPLAISTSDQHWSVTQVDCTARSLLRIYWPLS